MCVLLVCIVLFGLHDCSLFVKSLIGVAIKYRAVTPQVYASIKYGNVLSITAIQSYVIAYYS
jgi:hypothetical protein